MFNVVRRSWHWSKKLACLTFNIQLWIEHLNIFNVFSGPNKDKSWLTWSCQKWDIRYVFIEPLRCLLAEFRYKRMRQALLLHFDLPWWDDTHTAERCALWHHPAVQEPLNRCPCRLSKPDPRGLSKKQSARTIRDQAAAFLSVLVLLLIWTVKPPSVRNFHIFQISVTFKFPLFLHCFNFDLEEVKELCGIWHPEHEGSQIRWQLLDIWSVYLPFLVWRTAQDI